jgi:hypothetical protein
MWAIYFALLRRKIPLNFGVSNHLHVCISQLQETVHPIEQQLE